MLGIVLGVITAVVGPYDLTQSWLLTAYGIVAVLIALGADPETAWLNRLVAAAEADPGDGSSEGYAAASFMGTAGVLLWAGVVVSVSPEFI